MIVDSALYVAGVRRPGTFDTAEWEATAPLDCFSWTGMFEPTAAEFDEVRRHIELPDLVVEDALKAHQRPKLELYGDALFLTLKTVRYLDQEEDVEFGEIQVWVTQRSVLHVRHGAPADLAAIRHWVEGEPYRLQLGPSAVLHAIVDHVVDGYEPVVDGLEQDVREVEREVFNHQFGHNPVERVYGLMRTVLLLQDALSPLETPLGSLAEPGLVAVHPELREYFRDAHDHLVRVVRRVRTLHDLLTGILAANLTRVSIRQNEDMRKISAWVAIAAVPTMIAGIYGMNFTHMPELDERWGYPLIIGVMLVACGAMYRKFKRSGWL